MSNLEKLLGDRAKTHGPYCDVAVTTMRTSRLFNSCSVEQDSVVSFTIFNICHKLARVAHGNQYARDHWQDIAGYAQRMVETIDASEAGDAGRQSATLPVYDPMAAPCIECYTRATCDARPKP